MSEGIALIDKKMRSAGLSEVAIQAFLFQYQQLLDDDTGLIDEEAIEPIAQLPSLDERELPEGIGNYLRQTLVLKLNGGLGTSMGLEKAKSLLRVRGDLTFLDIIVKQFLELRASTAPGLGLFFMNSFSTSDDTIEALQSYRELGDPKLMQLLQNRVPKIDKETLLPISWPSNPALEWCPPGHADLYVSLYGSGLLKQLLEAGKKYLFVSNADNLGATLDPNLLRFFAESGAPFLMEVTRRTPSDRKGGHLARRLDSKRLVLRESAQCPDKDLASFQDIDRHRYFNTNNLWIRMDRLFEELTAGAGYIPLPLIRNEKNVDPRDKKSPKVFQLEAAMGAAIECFDGAAAVEVPRSRFSPVKTTNDLLAVRSDAYELDKSFRVGLRAERQGVPPKVELSDDYKLVDQLEELVAAGVPSLIRGKSLSVKGQWRFVAGVEIVGDVRFENASGEVKDVKPGVYRDSVVEE
ncbi:MAG: UTP--glucose-1-phosphate uridylyltransferase [Verrucomicrobia bacterium]|nr:UTP--glucose-1-phosphate uridylyltransferase [Verrucomicrobiota bacterium]